MEQKSFGGNRTLYVSIAISTCIGTIIGSLLGSMGGFLLSSNNSNLGSPFITQTTEPEFSPSYCGNDKIEAGEDCDGKEIGICNKNTQQCNVDCECEDKPQSNRYSCDNIKGCIEDNNGEYTDIKSCNINCFTTTNGENADDEDTSGKGEKYYSCDSIKGCIEDNNGEYTDIKSCNINCFTTTNGENADDEDTSGKGDINSCTINTLGYQQTPPLSYPPLGVKLCAFGNATNMHYDHSNYTFGRSCEEGIGRSCFAKGEYCGDGTVNGGEECDDGDKDDYNACNNSCKKSVNSCTINTLGYQQTPPLSYPPLGVKLCAFGNATNMHYDHSNYTFGRSCEEGIGRSCFAKGEYCGDGTVNGGEECDDGTNNEDGGDNLCSTTCKFNPAINGSCDDTTNLYDFDDSGDKWTINGNASSMCKEGNANLNTLPYIDFTPGHINNGIGKLNNWKWTCKGTQQTNIKGSDTTCEKKEEYCGDGTVNGGEQCDEGAKNYNGGDNLCNIKCKFNPAINGSCGDTANLYDFDDSGDTWTINGNASSMCKEGNANLNTLPYIDFTPGHINNGIGKLNNWKWICKGTQNTHTKGSDVTCEKKEEYCGDGTVNGGEECDDGTNNEDGGDNLCSTTCKFNPAINGSCGDTANLYDFDDSGDTWTINGNASSMCKEGNANLNTLPYIDFTPGHINNGIGKLNNWKWTCKGTQKTNIKGSDTTCEKKEEYCGDGTVNGGEECDDGTNNEDGGDNLCSTTCKFNPAINGSCDDTTNLYDFDDSGDKWTLTQNASSMCKDGTAGLNTFTYIVFTPGHINNGIGKLNNWKWICKGTQNTHTKGSDVTCEKKEEYCGDGTVNGGEECDDGDKDDYNACSNTCEKNTYYRTCELECGEKGKLKFKITAYPLGESYSFGDCFLYYPSPLFNKTYRLPYFSNGNRSTTYELPGTVGYQLRCNGFYHVDKKGEKHFVPGCESTTKTIIKGNPKTCK